MDEPEEEVDGDEEVDETQEDYMAD
jgi:hypothetical protein